MKRRFFAFASLAMLAACSGPADPPAEEAVSRSDAVQVPGQTANGTAPGKPDPAASSINAPIEDFGLQEGVYSTGGCPPAMASVSTFDGQGFNTRNFNLCTFVPASREGDTYVGEQTCTETYSKEKATEQMTLTVESRTSFTRVDDANGSRTYRLCADEKLADWGG